MQQQLQRQVSQGSSSHAGTPSTARGSSSHGDGQGSSSVSSLPMSRQTSLQASGGSLHRLSAGRCQSHCEQPSYNQISCMWLVSVLAVHAAAPQGACLCSTQC